MEDYKSIWEWFKSITPVWLRALILALVAGLALLISLTSCGASKSTVRVYNRADSTETTITVSSGDGGSTSVNVSPKISVDSTTLKII